MAKRAKKRTPPEAHTPGPWVVNTNRRYGNALGVICVEHPEFDAIDVLTVGWSDSEQEHKANARLIAAAPDLLQALKFALSEASGFACPAATERVLREAVSKAEG